MTGIYCGDRTSSQHHPVQHYRVYMIGHDGHIESAVDLQCENDGVAKAQARQYIDGCDVELWQGGRQIAVFERRSK